jgi:hypothetical protein
MRFASVVWAILLSMATFAGAAPSQDATTQPGPDLWALAKEKAAAHRFSTLFPAQDVRNRLGTDAGLDEAIAWCKATGVTKVYIEVFRDGYQAEKETLARARDRFRKEGFIVQGCVTTTRVGKRKAGFGNVSCYTDPETQDRLEEIFRYAAGLFDVVMIDDFWFTQCECDLCKKAKGDRTWADYRMELLDRMSRDRILKPAREVNPKVKVIIKYPEWYDRFHERGYDVIVEPELFDITWIGTETRDPDNPRWGKKPQYGAYWLSLWAAAFSRGKLGGGWYDPYGTTRNTYVEQGRQTILGLCRECMLFCYGGLHSDTGPDNVAALRRELPGHFDLAEFVLGETPRGVGTYKPTHSESGLDTYIFNFIGMLGIPMTADVKFPADSPSLFLTYHALADPALEGALGKAIEQGKAILLTNSMRDALPQKMRARLSAPNVHILEVGGKETKKSFYGVSDVVRDMMNWPREKVDALRRPLLEPLGVELSAPPRVSLYLYGQKKVVVENFNDEAVEIALTVRDAKGFDRAIVLPPTAEPKLETRAGQAKLTLPPRTLVALRVR